MPQSSSIYLSHGRSLFENVPALHYSLDGVAAGGHDNEMYVAYHSEAELAGIPPLQVPREGNRSRLWFSVAKKSVAERVGVSATRG